MVDLCFELPHEVAALVNHSRDQSYTDPERGVVLQGTAIGVWEPSGDRSVHLTYVQAISDLNGTYLGTLTRDA